MSPAKQRAVNRMQWSWLSRFNSKAKRSAAARRAAFAAAPARMAALTAERRSEIASAAGRARWYGDFEPHPCPYCESAKTFHNGIRRGRQNWYCRECRRQHISNQEGKAKTK